MRSERAAAPVRARWPAPRSACAAMDGIAIKAGPAGAAGVWQLAAASFAWVDTGDLIPAGMDTVVERERVRLGADGSVQITGPAPSGLNVRAAGEDFTAGELLVPAGHRMRPVDLAAAAAPGYATLKVARRPVAAIIATGDEIRPAVPIIGIPGYPLAAAVIFELFAVPLLTALQGRQPVDRGWRRAQGAGPRRASDPIASSWPGRAGAAPRRSAG